MNGYQFSSRTENAPLQMTDGNKFLYFAINSYWSGIFQHFPVIFLYIFFFFWE
jgi:hypothetical protein